MKKIHGGIMKTILIIEDDKKISRILELQLHHADFKTIAVYDGYSAAKSLKTNLSQADLVLLDVMMPGYDGFEILDMIRSIDHQIPVIFLTARDDTSDIVTGLQSGADDYVTKPFNFEELIARIGANLRKKDAKDENRLRYKSLMIDLSEFKAYRDGEELSLSKTEFDLLYYLVLNHGTVKSRDQIIEQVWGYDFDGTENIVDVYIKYLRDKIDRDREVKYIRTVRGRGYVIE